MSSTNQLRTSVDGVLEQAVEAGAVPNVAAIAADRHGVIYAGRPVHEWRGRPTPSAWTATSGSCR